MKAISLTNRALIWSVLSFVFCLGAWTAPAQAAPRVLLDYSAPDGCPSRADLLRRLARQFGGSLPETELSFELALDASGHGVLQIIEEGGERTQREVAGSTCEEVVVGAVFIIALTIDPQLLAVDSTVEDPTVDAPDDNASPEDTPPREPGSPVAPASSERDESDVPRTPASGTPWRVDAGATVLAIGGIAPGLSPGAGIWGQGTLAPGQVWSTSFRLQYVFAASKHTSQGRAADFQLHAGRFRLCNLRLAYAEWFAALCGSASLGRHRAEGAEVEVPDLSRLTWADVGAGTEVGWSVAALTLTLEAGALFPFRRDRFVVGDEELQIHKIPVAAPFFALNAGFRLGASSPR